MDRAEELVGRSLGRYQITALVGKGGMATVYKATHPGLGQTVAIKVLHPHMATDPDMLGRFHHEAQAVANLRHPNIVRVLDFDVVDDQYFMVMEYVDGPTLAAQLGGFVSRGGRMPGDEVARILEPLCSAVDYAHGQGMIHRDIKPANVLLTPQGEPVLTDYGIAKMVGVTQHTATGTVMGSAYYMSPEQAQGGGIDGRTDIYSLGVVLFEMLAGRVPYEGDTLATVLVKHITAPVPGVCALNPQLPPLLDDVVGVALAKDPAQRFQTGAALAAALRQGLKAPAAAPGTTTFERGAPAAPAAGFTRVEPASGAQAAEAWAARTAARDVYISYAMPDQRAAEAVCARLEAEGVSCWMAPRDVLPGRSFAQALSGAIHAARVFVLVFSAATNDSQQVERELHMADASRLQVVPLRLQDVQPHESIEYYLAGRSWVEASTPPLDAHLGGLVENVTLLLTHAPPRPAQRDASEATAVEPPPAPVAAAAAPAASTATTLEPALAAAVTEEPAAPGEPAAAEVAVDLAVVEPAAAVAAEPTPAGPAAAAVTADPTPAEPAAAVAPIGPISEEPPATELAAVADTEEPAAVAATEEPAAAAVTEEPAAADEPARAALVASAAAGVAEAVGPPPGEAAPEAEPVVERTALEPPFAPATASAAAPTAYEPPPAAATPATAPPAEATPAASPLMPSRPVASAQPGHEVAGLETAGASKAFRTRALAAAAVVGVAWIVVLFVLERFVL